MSYCIMQKKIPRGKFPCRRTVLGTKCPSTRKIPDRKCRRKIPDRKCRQKIPGGSVLGDEKIPQTKCLNLKNSRGDLCRSAMFKKF